MDETKFFNLIILGTWKTETNTHASSLNKTNRIMPVIVSELRPQVQLSKFSIEFAGLFKE